MNKNIILCGVGGQGTILASRLIATAAMNKDIPIKTAETIGMAQRGGSVFSHLRLGEGTNSPLIGKKEVDLIIGFEPGETVRQLPFLKKGGAVVVSSRPVIRIRIMAGAPQTMLFSQALPFSIQVRMDSIIALLMLFPARRQVKNHGGIDPPDVIRR